MLIISGAKKLLRICSMAFSPKPLIVVRGATRVVSPKISQYIPEVFTLISWMAKPCCFARFIAFSFLFVNVVPNNKYLAVLFAVTFCVCAFENAFLRWFGARESKVDVSC